jgi:SAM-dependent methyltransferase
VTADTRPDPADRPPAPIRFYDNRQKYLTFVSTCNEKPVIAGRASAEAAKVVPTPPALRIFDAGMGDATVLARLLRSSHRRFPTVPLLAVAKEISLEDVRFGLERMPDRFHEHPTTVLVITNLSYADAPSLVPSDPDKEAGMLRHVLRLEGDSADEYTEQIEALAPVLAEGWQTRPHPVTGNPSYVRPSVLVIHRLDHEFILDDVIPRPGRYDRDFDFVLASQAWRARTDASFKAQRVLAPLARRLAPGGRLLTIQSYGPDPGLELVRQLWPDEDPFRVDRFALLEALGEELGPQAVDYDLTPPSDADAIFRFEMQALPSEIGDRIGTSTRFAAWNAAVYVNQIEDERLDEVVASRAYLDATDAILQRYGGLWFNDESFVVVRRGGPRGGDPDGG